MTLAARRALVLLMLGIVSASVHAQSIMECRVIGRSGLFAGETFTANASFAADI